MNEREIAEARSYPGLSIQAQANRHGGTDSLTSTDRGRRQRVTGDAPPSTSIAGPRNIPLKDTKFCTYEYDKNAKIVKVQFHEKPERDSPDYLTIMRLMDLDEIALIMKNLIDEDLITLTDLFDKRTEGWEKFRLFTEGEKGMKEDKDTLHMHLSKFHNYLQQREAFAKQKRRDGGKGGKGVTTEVVMNSKKQTIDIAEKVIVSQLKQYDISNIAT